MTDELKERVEKFTALELPGQPQGMHMGTLYLVKDLWREIERLRAGRKAALEEAAKVADRFKDSANERYIAADVGMEKRLDSIRFMTAADIAEAIRALAGKEQQ